MLDSKLFSYSPEQSFNSDQLTEEIERRIMQAYVHLLFEPEGIGNVRTVAVGGFSDIDVHLTELPRDRLLMGVPPYWLEAFSAADQSPIDSLGFFEFDETEMRSAVELITDAMRGDP